MEDLPLSVQIAIMIGLLILSGFFSMSETAMMALNRFRLRHLAKQGNAAAVRTQGLLAQTEKLLSVLLIGNNVINTIVATLSASVALHAFPGNEWAVSIAAALIAVAIIIFAELMPKVLGAAFPEKIALPASAVVKPLLTLIYPVVWVLNTVVTSFLAIFGIKTNSMHGEETLSSEELRALVIDQSRFMPKKHRSILVNLFDLEAIEVNDLMTPRARVEALNINDPIEKILHQLVTCYHNKLPVYDGEINNILGLFHIRKALHHLEDGTLTHDEIRSNLTRPYFIPSETAIFEQLQHFQEDQQRLGIVVDEYSEVLGLLTMEDIIEEMVGEFTSAAPSANPHSVWDKNGQVVLDASMTLRQVNRRLKIELPLDGPKTLNGLILEQLQDIPEAQVGMKIGGVAMEVLQVDEHGVRSVRLLRPQLKQ